MRSCSISGRLEGKNLRRKSSYQVRRCTRSKCSWRFHSHPLLRLFCWEVGCVRSLKVQLECCKGFWLVFDVLVLKRKRQIREKKKRARFIELYPTFPRKGLHHLRGFCGSGERKASGAKFGPWVAHERDEGQARKQLGPRNHSLARPFLCRPTVAQDPKT